MNRTSRQCPRTRLVLMGAACFAATVLHPAPASAQEYSWILVRPAAKASDAELERARAALGVKPADRLVATPSGSEIWRTSMPPKAAEARMKETRSVYTMEASTNTDPQAIVSPASEAELSAQAKAAFAKVKARGYAKRVGLVRTPPPALASVVLRYADSVTWQLFDKVQFKGTRHAKFSRIRNAGRFAWVGGLDAKGNDCDAALFANGFASVTFGNEHLYGRFEKGRDIYQIVPLGDRFHATIEVDPDKLPDQPDLAGIEDEGGDMLDLAGIEDEGGDMLDLAGIEDEGGDMLDRKGVLIRVPPTFTTCKAEIPGCNTGAKAQRATIRVGVAFTREALQDLPLIAAKPGATANTIEVMSTQHYADYLVNITNAAFLRSGVGSRVELASAHVFDRLENAYADSKLLLAALRTNPADAPVRPVHQWRDEKGADIVVLLTLNATYPNVGPVAGLSPPPSSLGNPEQAYSIVVTKSADAQLSFQHELGHVMGAGHNWQANTPARFSWAHGFRNQCAWRTIMSYEDRVNCQHGTPRYALLSSCNVVVNGNTLAGSNLENNTRVVNEQAGMISKYRP